MKTYRIYEGFRNAVGGVEGCSTGWGYIAAETAEEAAKKFWELHGWPDVNESTVIVATDDDADSFHLSPVN